MDIEQHFPELSPDVLEISNELQSIILRLFPAAEVTSDEDNIGFGFGSGYKDMVFVISPYTKHVNLGIVNGASLDDPEGLMQGSGKVHRHIKLHLVKDVHAPGLGELMQRALREAEKRIRGSA